MSEAQNTSLTQGNITRAILRFALPFMGSSIFQLLYNLVDMIVVGQFSDSAGISAVNNAGQIMQLVTFMVTGIGTGATVLIGRHVGAGRDKEVGRTICNVIYLFAAVAAVMTALVLLLGNAAVAAMQVPQAAVTPSRAYLRICGIGTVFIVGYNVVSCILRGLGDSKRPMIFIAISCVANIFGDLLLVGGFHMGAAGAAAATVAAQALSFLIALITLRRSGLNYPLDWTLEAKRGLQVLRLGLPVGLQDVLVTVSFLIITVVVNMLGLAQSAAVGVVERIVSTVMMIPSAFLAALAAFTAQNMGAQKPERAVRAMRISILVCLAISAVAVAVIQLFPALLARAFTSDAEVIAHCVLYMRTYSIDCLTVCFVFCMNGFFSGCGHTRFSMANGLASTFLVRVPLVIWFATWPNVTMLQIGMAAPAASLAQIAMQLIYYRTGRWKTE